MQRNTANILLFNLKTALFATIAIITLIQNPIRVLGESHNLVSNNFKNTQIWFILAQKKPAQKKPPKRGGNPSAPQGTGSRSHCLEKQITLWGVE